MGTDWTAHPVGILVVVPEVIFEGLLRVILGWAS